MDKHGHSIGELALIALLVIASFAGGIYTKGNLMKDEYAGARRCFFHALWGATGHKVEVDEVYKLADKGRELAFFHEDVLNPQQDRIHSPKDKK